MALNTPIQGTSTDIIKKAMVLINQKLKEILAIIFISFGGLSIHLQIKGIISDSNISYLKFLKYRLYQTIISVFVVLII